MTMKEGIACDMCGTTTIAGKEICTNTDCPYAEEEVKLLDQINAEFDSQEERTYLFFHLLIGAVITLIGMFTVKWAWLVFTILIIFAMTLELWRHDWSIKKMKIDSWIEIAFWAYGGFAGIGLWVVMASIFGF